MDDYGPETYGDRIAAVYDAWYTPRLDPAAAVELLAGLAGKGRALELGIGTGRVAIPLAARGVQVEGIDASEEMVAVLRSKPGGADIDVHMGDFAEVGVEGMFSLIYIPFTTFFALPSQQSQLHCMRNVRSHLDEGGAFVLDAFVPDVARYRNNQCTTVVDVGVDRVLLDVSIHDPVAQVITSSHVVLANPPGLSGLSAPPAPEGSGGEKGAVRLYPVLVRYAWPAELDAMALACGLKLEARYGDYDGKRFDASSTRHVSVYRAA